MSIFLYYTLCLKKQYTRLLIETSVNVDRFSKFFYWQISKETLYVTIAEPSDLTVSLHYHAKLSNLK